MPTKNLIPVKVYLTKEEFAVVSEYAAKAGFRHGGIKLYNQKEHGMADEVIPNTKGIAQFLKHCFEVYKASDSEKLLKIAKALA